MVSDVFTALADPTRRDIFGRLTTGGPTTATALSHQLDISRQAVAKHLGILADAGMAAPRRVGRETRFEADLASLAELRGWIDGVEQAWTLRLGALAAAAQDDAGTG